MKSPLVSICVPTYNRVEFLKRSLTGILAQRHEPLEILIGDNASTDATADVCRQLAQTDPRVRHIRREKNIGIYPNHNLLIEESGGEYLCFLHDDDEYDPHLIEQAVLFLNEHPDVGLVAPNWRLIDEEGSFLGSRIHTVPPIQKGMDYIEQTLRSGRSTIGLSGTLIRRSALGRSRFNETGPLGFADFVLWFEIAERARIGHIPQELYAYRLHTRSLSRRTIFSITQDYRQAVLGYCSDYLKRRPQDAPTVQRWRRFIDRYLFWILAYEISLQCWRKGPSAQPITASRYRTIFERMDYRLSQEEFQQVLTQWRSIPCGPLEKTARNSIDFLLSIHWTWPIGQLAPHAPSFRRLLGLHG